MRRARAVRSCSCSAATMGVGWAVSSATAASGGCSAVASTPDLGAELGVLGQVAAGDAGVGGDGGEGDRVAGAGDRPQGGAGAAQGRLGGVAAGGAVREPAGRQSGVVWLGAGQRWMRWRRDHVRITLLAKERVAVCGRDGCGAAHALPAALA